MISNLTSLKLVNYLIFHDGNIGSERRELFGFVGLVFFVRDRNNKIHPCFIRDSALKDMERLSGFQNEATYRIIFNENKEKILEASSRKLTNSCKVAGIIELNQYDFPP